MPLDGVACCPCGVAPPKEDVTGPGRPIERVDLLCAGPPAEDITDGLSEEVDWPCVTAAYEGVIAGPPHWVRGPSVVPPLEAESSGAIEHPASPRVTLLDGVSGIPLGCSC